MNAPAMYMVSRETVVSLFSILDPEGVKLRKRKRRRHRKYYAKGPIIICGMSIRRTD